MVRAKSALQRYLNVIVISDYFGGETTTETITLSRQQDITGLMKTFDAKTAEELAGKEIQIYMNAFFWTCRHWNEKGE